MIFYLTASGSSNFVLYIVPPRVEAIFIVNIPIVLYGLLCVDSAFIDSIISCVGTCVRVDSGILSGMKEDFVKKE
jgi:hypothetical protein